VFLLSSLPGMVFADPATDCGGGSQIEIGACVAETLDWVDATVGIYLGFAISSAEELDEVTGRKVAVPALEVGQAAWSAYRDADCHYVGVVLGDQAQDIGSIPANLAWSGTCGRTDALHAVTPGRWRPMLEQAISQTRDFLNGSVSIAIGIAMSGRAQPKKPN
jgi:uncharacterized protein YecT (DUF1311 family)